MSSFFLHNTSIDVVDYNDFKFGILDLIGINRHPDHLFFKHESIYSLPILLTGLYNAKIGNEEQEIYRFLEQLSPCETLIETEQDANNHCKSNINGFLGINFQNSAIGINKQVLNNATYKNWCFQFLTDNNFFLVKTPVLPENKKAHLSDHHGKKELNALCERIRNNPFVLEMQSTGWGGKEFIRKIHANGLIEIVLYKTEKQYALNVQTTGTDLLETTAIAEILQNKYDN
jgi:hypothetical protein